MENTPLICIKCKTPEADHAGFGFDHVFTQQSYVDGRPSLYTQQLANKICEQLAQGRSMRTVCRAEDMPSMATIFNWLRIHKDFLEQYDKAKQESTDAMAEDILDISDDGTNDYTSVDGKLVANKEHVQRSRLRVDTRKWLMAKMKPKKYADKMDVTSGNEPLKGNSIIFNNFDASDSK